MAANEAKGPTVLVVDDQAAIRSIERRVLETHGYHVLEAEGAREAIDLLSGGTTLDLLIADLDMPEVRGEEMVSRIRKTRPGLKVLYVTGQINTLMNARPLEDTEAFLEKPFTVPGLAEAVSLLLFGSLKKPAS
jgi:two-component system cell cycle sensor histidine kinase/response regulator CckA